MDFLEEALNDREANGTLRKLKYSQGLIDFCSNDYLGVARDPFILKEFRASVGSLSATTGSTGSRLLTGNNLLVEESEQNICDFFRSKSALYYSSGYAANVGLLSCVAGRTDTILLDELCHASLIDGARLSHATVTKFEHNDVAALENHIKKARGRVFVVVESVYSMDGDLAPLDAMASICGKNKAHLIVDEAHGAGVFGPKGEGVVVELGLQKEVFARIITFGKAFGYHCAAVLGNTSLKPYLINFSRSQIYSTAIPVHSALLIDSVLEWFRTNYKDQEIRSKCRLFQSLIKESSFSVISSESQIFSFLIPGKKQVKRVSEELIKRGFNVLPIMSPTVKEGTERLRISVHSFNTEDQMRALLNLLGALL